MNLEAKDIKEFQQLYAKRYGVKLDYKSAHAKLSVLVQQLQVVYKPITSEQMELFKDEERRAMQKGPKRYII